LSCYREKALAFKAHITDGDTEWEALAELGWIPRLHESLREGVRVQCSVLNPPSHFDIFVPESLEDAADASVCFCEVGCLVGKDHPLQLLKVLGFHVGPQLRTKSAGIEVLIEVCRHRGVASDVRLHVPSSIETVMQSSGNSLPSGRVSLENSARSRSTFCERP